MGLEIEMGKNQEGGWDKESIKRFCNQEMVYLPIPLIHELGIPAALMVQEVAYWSKAYDSEWIPINVPVLCHKINMTERTMRRAISDCTEYGILEARKYTPANEVVSLHKTRNEYRVLTPKLDAIREAWDDKTKAKETLVKKYPHLKL